MFSSNDDTNNNNGVYPLALYLSSLCSHDNNMSSASYNHHQHHQLQQHHNQLNLHPNDHLMAAPQNHQFSSPSMPESLINYMPFLSNNVMMDQNLVNGGCSDRVEALRGIKKPEKKDRHSKIHTAQGLRDRRVRLSIGIARQFFDLQDMLGFDKASKTLDWLLKKSRKAIRKVTQAKKLNNGDFSSANIEDEWSGNNIGDEEEGEEEDEEEEEEDDDEDKSFVSGSSSEGCEEMVYEAKKRDQIDGFVQREKKNNELSHISSKGSRGKAREGGKERARDKTGSRNTDLPQIYQISQSQVLLDSMRSTTLNVGKAKMPSSVHCQDMTSFYEQPIEEAGRFQGLYLANQESNSFITRKTKPSALSYGQQNGGVMSENQSSTSDNITILPQNWENYDQNPFLDAPFGVFFNMNASTRLQ
ncbi:PREDICTED: transcription factor TCP1 isoform X2 [Tarenaya hassleriana]|uniref:transcription factor TCP1 isoform X2 n=1 Tax=Tarenaya hassleriana TaxID=28532 RepID=UPI00053CA20F|nr:PREDICTED: transcription factor TCP1 isoform X2 [Tarenaya hassleriana]